MLCCFKGSREPLEQASFRPLGGLQGSSSSIYASATSSPVTASGIAVSLPSHEQMAPSRAGGLGSMYGSGLGRSPTHLRPPRSFPTAPGSSALSRGLPGASPLSAAPLDGPPQLGPTQSVGAQSPGNHFTDSASTGPASPMLSGSPSGHGSPSSPMGRLRPRPGTASTGTSGSIGTPGSIGATGSGSTGGGSGSRSGVANALSGALKALKRHGTNIGIKPPSDRASLTRITGGSAPSGSSVPPPPAALQRSPSEIRQHLQGAAPKRSILKHASTGHRGTSQSRLARSSKSMVGRPLGDMAAVSFRANGGRGSGGGEGNDSDRSVGFSESERSPPQRQRSSAAGGVSFALDEDDDLRPGDGGGRGSGGGTSSGMEGREVTRPMSSRQRGSKVVRVVAPQDEEDVAVEAAAAIGSSAAAEAAAEAALAAAAAVGSSAAAEAAAVRAAKPHEGPMKASVGAVVHLPVADGEGRALVRSSSRSKGPEGGPRHAASHRAPAAAAALLVAPANAVVQFRRPLSASSSSTPGNVTGDGAFPEPDHALTLSDAALRTLSVQFERGSGSEDGGGGGVDVLPVPGPSALLRPVVQTSTGGEAAAELEGATKALFGTANEALIERFVSRPAADVEAAAAASIDVVLAAGEAAVAVAASYRSGSRPGSDARAYSLSGVDQLQSSTRANNPHTHQHHHPPLAAQQPYNPVYLHSDGAAGGAPPRQPHGDLHEAHSQSHDEGLPLPHQLREPDCQEPSDSATALEMNTGGNFCERTAVAETAGSRSPFRLPPPPALSLGGGVGERAESAVGQQAAAARPSQVIMPASPQTPSSTGSQREAVGLGGGGGTPTPSAAAAAAAALAFSPSSLAILSPQSGTGFGLIPARGSGGSGGLRTMSQLVLAAALLPSRPSSPSPSFSARVLMAATGARIGSTVVPEPPPPLASPLSTSRGGIQVSLPYPNSPNTPLVSPTPSPSTRPLPGSSPAACVSAASPICTPAPPSYGEMPVSGTSGSGPDGGTIGAGGGVGGLLGPRQQSALRLPGPLPRAFSLTASEVADSKPRSPPGPRVHSIMGRPSSPAWHQANQQSGGGGASSPSSGPNAGMRSSPGAGAAGIGLGTGTPTKFASPLSSPAMEPQTVAALHQPHPSSSAAFVGSGTVGGAGAAAAKISADGSWRQQEASVPTVGATALAAVRTAFAGNVGGSGTGSIAASVAGSGIGSGVGSGVGSSDVDSGSIAFSPLHPQSHRGSGAPAVDGTSRLKPHPAHRHSHHSSTVSGRRPSIPSGGRQDRQSLGSLLAPNSSEPYEPGDGEDDGDGDDDGDGAGGGGGWAGHQPITYSVQQRAQGFQHSHSYGSNYSPDGAAASGGGGGGGRSGDQQHLAHSRSQGGGPGGLRSGFKRKTATGVEYASYLAYRNTGGTDARDAGAGGGGGGNPSYNYSAAATGAAGGNGAGAGGRGAGGGDAPPGAARKSRTMSSSNIGVAGRALHALESLAVNLRLTRGSAGSGPGAGGGTGGGMGSLDTLGSGLEVAPLLGTGGAGFEGGGGVAVRRPSDLNASAAWPSGGGQGKLQGMGELGSGTGATSGGGGGDGSPSRLSSNGNYSNMRLRLGVQGGASGYSGVGLVAASHAGSGDDVMPEWNGGGAAGGGRTSDNLGDTGWGLWEEGSHEGQEDEEGLAQEAAVVAASAARTLHGSVPGPQLQRRPTAPASHLAHPTGDAHGPVAAAMAVGSRYSTSGIAASAGGVVSASRRTSTSGLVGGALPAATAPPERLRLASSRADAWAGAAGLTADGDNGGPAATGAEVARAGGHVHSGGLESLPGAVGGH